MSREKMLQGVVATLKKNGFVIETFFGSNTCFDIIAKRTSDTLVLKVYDNIDSIRKEQGKELKKLSQALNATPIIVGSKTKVFILKDNVVYSRYGVQAITPRSLEKTLGNQNPKVRYFKGKEIVNIDSGELTKKRKELKISVHDLAQRIGVATDTIQRFEKGHSTSLETARKLEKELDENLVKKIDLLEHKKTITEFDDVPKEILLEKMQDLGLKMALFEHSPFRAFGKTKEGMFISTGKGKFDIPKKAIELKKASTIIDSDSIIVTHEFKYKKIGGVPIIEESDLDTIHKVKELKKLIDEREED